MKQTLELTSRLPKEYRNRTFQQSPQRRKPNFDKSRKFWVGPGGFGGSRRPLQAWFGATARTWPGWTWLSYQ